jgi:FkbH-like protein
VIGEDGMEGIAVGGTSPEGAAHAELQRYLKELRSRGILLAVASKNNPDEARLPFAGHPGMILRLDDFAAFEANWDDKATNLRRVAARLSVGTESFVFLDDNPVERAWIRSQLPEVAVVELGRSPATYVRDLDAGRYFEALSVSAEDRLRAERYGRETERLALREQAGTLEEFLAGLQMRGSVAPVSDANLARVTQLVNKTNQFNVTTRRYTEAQIVAIAAAGGWCGAFELSDRFGDHGLVGVLFCVPAPTGDAWEIDTWLMSCRVLGRQFERFMLDRAVDAAHSAGVRRLVGLYRATAKNGLVADLFDQLGFERRGKSAEETSYELDIASAMSPCTSFIERVDEARHAPA